MTQENKHTPAPWFVVNDAIYRRPKENLYEYGGSVAGDQPLALVRKGWYGDDEESYPVKANANLIAAAPDMYDALENIIKSELFKKLSVGQRDSAIRATMKAQGEL